MPTLTQHWFNILVQHFVFTRLALPLLMICNTYPPPTPLRDAPFDIWGGGLEFLLLAIFFFTSGGKQVFFWRSTSDNFFFMFCRINFLSYAFPIMYVTIWCFFWSTYFSPISTTNFFFLLTVSTNFFSDFCGDKLFFSILI